jgi:ABC-type multidrug transport system fused ATPase/permease subunit
MTGRLQVGDVVGKVWRIYVDQAPVLMPAAAVVFALSGIVAAVLVSIGSLGAVLLAEVIVIVSGMLFTAMVVELVADVQDGRRDSSPGQLLRAASPVLGQLIVVSLVAGVAILVGVFLLVVPALILITIWAVFVPVLVLERPPGLGALARSRELVRGNGWQVFGVLLLLFVVVGALSLVLAGVAASAGTAVGIVVRVVLGVLTQPLAALAAAVLYFDLLALHGEPRPSGSRPSVDSPQDPFGTR